MRDRSPLGAGRDEPFGASGRSGSEAGAAPGPASGAKRARRRPVEESFEDLAEIATHLRTLALVQSDRARLRFRAFRSRVGKQALEMVALAALAVSGVALVAIGLTGAFVALFEGSPWLGKIASGAVLLAVLGAWLAIRNHQRERRELELHRARYDEIEQSHRRRFGDRAPDPPSADGRGAS